MKKATEKQKLILSEAKALFFKFGVKKVTVEEICSKCTISKKTFYNFYKNKYVLIEEILDEFVKDDILIFERIKKENISFREKILKMTHEKMQKYASAEAVFFSDVLENCKELQEYVSGVIKDGEREFFKFVSEEQENNKLRKDIPARFILYLLSTKSTQMIFDPEVEKMFPDFNNRVQSILDCFMNGIEGSNSNSS